MSYWPPPPLAIRDTISSDDPVYFALTWHPVWCGKAPPLSSPGYPPRAMGFRCPARPPLGAGVFRRGVGGGGGAAPGRGVAPPRPQKTPPSETPAPVCRPPASLL